MRALVYESFQGPLTLQKVPDPTPKNHGVIVKVKATGLCRSDWHGWMGHDPDIVLPHIPGHELAGEIAAIGRDVKNFKIGQRVTVPFVCGCGSCRECSSGNHQVCDHQSQPGFTHWGSFAEYVALDHADINLVALPDAIDDVTAASLGCRFITSYRAIVAQGCIKANQYVAVHGCGGVGLSAIMIAKAFGAKVIAVDLNEESLALAKTLGAETTINARNTLDLIPSLLEASEGGVHVSLDAFGSETTCLNSINSLRKRGKHIQVGLMTENHKPKIPMDKVIANELELLGSHGMQAHKYPEMLELIKAGKLRPERLLERTLTLEEAGKALPKMDQGVRKGVLVINSF